MRRLLYQKTNSIFELPKVRMVYCKSRYPTICTADIQNSLEPISSNVCTQFNLQQTIYTTSMRYFVLEGHFESIPVVMIDPQARFTVNPHC